MDGALQEREGFSGALRAAMKMVETPTVLVVQHDYPLIRPVDLRRWVAFLNLTSPAVAGFLLG